MQNFVHAPFKLVFLLDDGHQDVDADRDPYLRLDRVVGGPIECFDAQMLLDPFEEKFHLPTAFVKFGDRQCVEHKVVGEEHKALARVGIDILDAS